MITRLISFLILLIIPLNVFGQYFTESQLQTIHDNKTGAEGDLYMDTLNNAYFIGTTNGSLIQFNSDSNHINTILSKRIINDASLSEESETKVPSQKSVKNYVDSVTNTSVTIENELFFDGGEHADPAYHDYYYVSMKVDDGYIVVRYNKQNINDEARAKAENTGQPITLNTVVGLTFI